MTIDVFTKRWRRFWLRFSGPRGAGKIASWLASWNTTPYHGREVLARRRPEGFVAPSANLKHPCLNMGRNVLIADRVTIWQWKDGGPIILEDQVNLYGDSFLTTMLGAKIRIGAGTHVQPGCHIYALLGNINIGCKVEIAARCAFYSADHGFAAGELIMNQPLLSKGPINVGDGAWLGHGVIVLNGVDIGTGAIIGAGSVVSRSIPANAIAVGAPARVVKYRA